MASAQARDAAVSPTQRRHSREELLTGRKKSVESVGRALLGLGAGSDIREPMVGAQGTCWTTNVKTLGLTCILFTSITVAQAIAATIAHSQALWIDCISMAVDAFSYAANMVVETQVGKPSHAVLELVVGVVSVAFLIFFTSRELVGSIEELLGEGESDEAEREVNPYIVMTFAILGLLIDAVSLKCFWRSHQDAGETSLNMWTALLHVGADAFRSITTLIMGIIIMFNPEKGAQMDSWASAICGVTILLGALSGVWECLKSFAALVCGSDAKPAAPAEEPLSGRPREMELSAVRA